MTMLHRVKHHQPLIMGFAFGVVFCLGVSLGFAGKWWSSAAASGQAAQSNSAQAETADPLVPAATAGSHEMPKKLQQLMLQASSADSSDTIAMATGPVEEGVEGLFVLDFLTGDLYCWVISAQGGWMAEFKTNVMAQLGISDKSKAPRYVMTTGFWNPRGQSGQARPAGSVCYVADANTGKVAAFSFPWNRNASQQGAAQGGAMLPLATAATRSPNLQRN